MLSVQEIESFEKIANNARRNILKMVHAAKSGHPGGSLSGVDILTVLYNKSLNIPADWDKNIYTDEYQNTIGNLTLLPEEINESASNKGWAEKYYYYKHLAETDVDKVTQLAEAAKNDGITLKDSVIGNLRNATHNEHIVPIVNIGKDGKWDAGLIQQRSERICEILWERVKAWLEE